MKLYITITSLFLFVASQLYSQTIPPKQTALCWFNLAVEEEMYLPMELESETLYAIMFQQDKEEAKALMQNSLNIIYSKVNDSSDITLLPIESLKDKVKYSRMGYPIASLKKASKKGSYEQYVKVDIEVSAFKRSSNTISGEVEVANEVDHEVERIKVRPQIRVILKFADKDGNTIDKVQGRYRHEEKVEITSRRLSTMGWSVAFDQEADPIPYYYFLEKAVTDLVSKLNE